MVRFLHSANPQWNKKLNLGLVRMNQEKTQSHTLYIYHIFCFFFFFLFFSIFIIQCFKTEPQPPKSTEAVEKLTCIRSTRIQILLFTAPPSESAHDLFYLHRKTELNPIIFLSSPDQYFFHLLQTKKTTLIWSLTIKSSKNLHFHKALVAKLIKNRSTFIVIHGFWRGGIKK